MTTSNISLSKQDEELKLFSSQYVEKLYISAKKSVSSYELNKFPYEEEYPKGGSGILIPNNFDLVLPEAGDKKDLENTKKFFELYRFLSPTQASDPRFWTYLTHAKYWDYMRKRWPSEVAKIPFNRIKDRYFLRRLNLEALTRNGLSRLWWYGYLTYDDNRSSPWELTEVLLSRADLVVGITERGFGCNENIRTALLEFLLENENIRKSEELTRNLLVKLNLIGGVKNLAFLESKEIKEILQKI